MKITNTYNPLLVGVSAEAPELMVLAILAPDSTHGPQAIATGLICAQDYPCSLKDTLK